MCFESLPRGNFAGKAVSRCVPGIIAKGSRGAGALGAGSVHKRAWEKAIDNAHTRPVSIQGFLGRRYRIYHILPAGPVLFFL